MNERLSDYLLGELEGVERERFEAQLARDPALAAEAERLRPVVTRLESLDRSAWELPEAPALPPITPREPAAAPVRERRPAWWRRALVVRPLAAATLAVVLLALGVGAGLLLGGDGGDDGAAGGRVVALDPVEPLGGEASGTATISAKDGRATVNVRGLPPSAKGDFYELWLLNTPDDLVSLGSFRVPASGDVDVTVPLPANPDAFAALDVSVEPPDGNPAHSSRSVLRAPLAPA